MMHLVLNYDISSLFHGRDLEAEICEMIGVWNCILDFVCPQVFVVDPNCLVQILHICRNYEINLALKVS